MTIIDQINILQEYSNYQINVKHSTPPPILSCENTSNTPLLLWHCPVPILFVVSILVVAIKNGITTIQA